MGGFMCVMRTMYMCHTISEWDVCKECGRAAGPGCVPRPHAEGVGVRF